MYLPETSLDFEFGGTLGQSHTDMLTLKGKGNRCGGAAGKTVFADNLQFITKMNATAQKKEAMGSKDEEGKKSEHERYFEAHARCCEELRRVYGELRGESDASWVFLMQLTLLCDELFTEIPRLYLSDGKSACECVRCCKEYFINVLCKSEGGENLKFLRADVEDVALRMLSALGTSEKKSERLEERFREISHDDTSCIMICPFPLPSQIAALRKSVAGVVVGERSGAYSVFELASSFEIPLVVCKNEIFEELEEEISGESSAQALEKRSALIDSDKGCLYIDPDLDTVTTFSKVIQSKRVQEKRMQELSALPTLTVGGDQVLLMCELSKRSELPSSAVQSCDGICRVRKDVFGFEHETAEECDEEELFEGYRKIAEAYPTKPVIIRALSSSAGVHLRSVIGEEESEDNGELYVLSDSTLCTQLRAIMRAAVYGNLQLAVPQSGRYSDLSSCARMMEEVASQLYSEDREYTQIPIGSVIDSVASALMCKKLLDESDFLIVERAKIADEISVGESSLYENEGDSVINDALKSLLTQISEQAKKAKKKAILCLGKNSSDKDVSLALKCGFLALGADASSLLRVKRVIMEQ